MMMMMMISAESRWGVDPDLRDENEGRRVQLHFGHYVVLPGELVSTVTTCLSVPYADNLCVRIHGNSLSVCIQGIFLLWVPGLGIGVFAALYTAGNILALIRYEPPTSNRVKPDLRGPNPVTHHPRRRAQTAQSSFLQSSTTNHFDSSLVKFSVCHLSTMFLIGPCRQLKSMCAVERVLATIMMLVRTHILTHTDYEAPAYFTALLWRKCKKRKWKQRQYAQ